MKSPGELEKVRVVEGVSIILDDPFLSLRDLSAYTGLSMRTLRNFLRDSFNPLPYYRIGGRVLVKKSEYDRWAARFRQVGRPDVNRVVEAVVRELTAGSHKG